MTEIEKDSLKSQIASLQRIGWNRTKIIAHYANQGISVSELLPAPDRSNLRHTCPDSKLTLAQVRPIVDRLLHCEDARDLPERARQAREAGQLAVAVADGDYELVIFHRGYTLKRNGEEIAQIRGVMITHVSKHFAARRAY